MAKVPSILLIVITGVGLTLAPSRTDACSCSPPGPPCENYWKVEHVFDGTVQSISETAHMDSLEPGREVQVRRRLVRFQVHRAYKNVEGREVEVVTGYGGGDCGYDFKPGVRYLVFGTRSAVDGRIEANICSATRPYAGSSEAAAWLDSLAKPSNGATVYGAIVRQDGSLTYGETPPRKGLSDVQVVLQGPGGERRTRSVTGHYRFSGLPAGEYTIRAELPEELWNMPRAMDVSLPHARACAERDFHTAINGRISGLVLRHDGAPALHQMVEALPEGSALDRFDVARFAALVGEEGRFEFERLPPGRYVVGVNLHDRTGPHNPYPRVVFPGVSPDTPAIIEVGNGTAVSIGTLTLPPPLAFRRITGTVVGLDDKPVPEILIVVHEMSGATPRRSGLTRTDGSGAFEVRVRSNGLYRVRAVLEQAPRPAVTVESEPLRVTDADVTGLRLRLER